MVDGGRQWALPRGSVLPSILLVLYVQCALGEGGPGLGNDALVDGSEHHFSASPSSASALLGDCVEQLQRGGGGGGDRHRTQRQCRALHAAAAPPALGGAVVVRG